MPPKTKHNQGRTRKSKNQTTSEPVPETVSETVPETTPETVSETVPETTPETVPETVPETTPEAVENPEQTPVKNRGAPSRESVESEFDELLNCIETEISKLRESPSKSKGIKFLRAIGKSLKTLKSHALRLSKQKKVIKRNNENSGFKKPVQISKELEKFTGWKSGEVHSRLDVTRFLCKYVNDHNLQTPNDRRNIDVARDPALKKLLKYSNTDKPIRYCDLQTYIRPHYLTPTQSK